MAFSINPAGEYRTAPNNQWLVHPEGHGEGLTGVPGKLLDLGLSTKTEGLTATPENKV